MSAEDSVYFSYESTVEYSYWDDKYPSGSFVAAFGARRDVSLGYYLEGPGPIKPCVGRNGKKPSCRDIAEALGVAYRNQGIVAAEAASANDEDYDGGINDEEWLAAHCQKLPLRQKRSLAINGGHMMIGKRNITCPSPTLLSLDYQNYPTPTWLSTPAANWWTASSHSNPATMTITTPTSSTPSTLSTYFGDVLSIVLCSFRRPGCR